MSQRQCRPIKRFGFELPVLELQALNGGEVELPGVLILFYSRKPRRSKSAASPKANEDKIIMIQKEHVNAFHTASETEFHNTAHCG
jgi:hypothetical protein